jgi:hypothetical protein
MSAGPFQLDKDKSPADQLRDLATEVQHLGGEFNRMMAGLSLVLLRVADKVESTPSPVPTLVVPKEPGRRAPLSTAEYLESPRGRALPNV